MHAVYNTLELVTISYTHFLGAIFYEVQELSAKQCIIDIAIESELSGNESQSCMKSTMITSAPRMCTM